MRLKDGKPYASSSLESRFESPRFECFRPKQPQQFLAITAANNQLHVHVRTPGGALVTHCASLRSYLLRDVHVKRAHACCMYGTVASICHCVCVHSNQMTIVYSVRVQHERRNYNRLCLQRGESGDSNSADQSRCKTRQTLLTSSTTRPPRRLSMSS